MFGCNAPANFRNFFMDERSCFYRPFRNSPSFSNCPSSSRQHVMNVVSTEVRPRYPLGLVSLDQRIQGRLLALGDIFVFQQGVIEMEAQKE
jgi:hypothetical protein